MFLPEFRPEEMFEAGVFRYIEQTYQPNSDDVQKIIEEANGKWTDYLGPLGYLKHMAEVAAGDSRAKELSTIFAAIDRFDKILNVDKRSLPLKNRLDLLLKGEVTLMQLSLRSGSSKDDGQKHAYRFIELSQMYKILYPDERNLHASDKKFRK